jgi:hypothetical protein
VREALGRLGAQHGRSGCDRDRLQWRHGPRQSRAEQASLGNDRSRPRRRAGRHRADDCHAPFRG